MNEEESPNVDPPVNSTDEGSDINNVPEERQSVLLKVIRAIQAMKDANAYTPDILAGALAKVLDYLYMVCPLSPPPYGYEERGLAGNSNSRHGILMGSCSLVPNNSRTLHHDSDMLVKVLDKIKESLEDVPGERQNSNDGSISSGIGSNKGEIERRQSMTEPTKRVSLELANVFKWNFDVINLEIISDKRPLSYAGTEIFSAFDAQKVLKTDLDTIKSWLTVIESNYHYTNPYHNATHAADVLQACAYFLRKPRLEGFLSATDNIAVLIAATVHDIDHPGKTNAFLINTRHKLAILYNDKAVLESHHTAFAFNVTLNDPRVNIFKNLDDETYNLFRLSILDMVSATEMVNHANHVKNFAITVKAFRDAVEDSKPTELKTVNISSIQTPDNITFTKRIIIKCADVSNPGRKLRISGEWVLRICEEFFRQAEEEKQYGLPLTLPSFDRETCSVTNAQLGFNDFFVQNLFLLWHEFADIPEVMIHLRKNYQFWKKMEDRKICHMDELKEYLIASKIGVASLYTIT